MPETAATYELQINTAADLAALEKARAQYRLLVEELRKLVGGVHHSFS